MNKLSCTIARLAIQIGALILLYAVCRLSFLLINKDYFNDAWHLSSSAPLFLNGTIFDVSAIFMTNALFIFLSLLPFTFVLNNRYQLMLKYLFLVSNGFFLLLNCIDTIYFPFIQRRMQSDALLFVTGEKGNDFFHLLPTFLIGYWYVWAGFIIMMFLLARMYRYSLRFKEVTVPRLKHYVVGSAVFCASAVVCVIAARGGFQMKPIDLIHAAEVSDAKDAPVVLNTPFSIIKTMNKKKLAEVQYFPDQALSDCDRGLHMPFTGGVLKKQNVVIIIVESLSKEYISFFHGRSHTPFLDSLFSNSLVFSNAFANAKESIQGIPAVLASIPSCQDEPFIFSPYSNDNITSVANLLKPLGYHSSFFHGGTTGTMGFNSFSRLAGFDHYYGREDYNNDKDYDGSWGIWDEPFLQYMAGKLSAEQQPFLSTVFTLNTHHPFIVPQQYADRFRQDGHPILSCVQYADFALREFFDKIKDTPWFDNTLFVITADHTGPGISDNDGLNTYRIPIVFYKPDGSLKGVDPTIANQIDILPSVMHLLHYPYPYFSLGKDLFNPDCEKFAVNYNQGIYECIDSAYCYQFNGEEPVGFYNWKQDSAFKKNLQSEHLPHMTSCDEKLKRFIQVFNNSLITDKMQVGTAVKNRLARN